MKAIDGQAINLNPGTYSFEAAITSGLLVARLARQTTATPTLWAAGVSVLLDLDVSSDGGSSWRNLGGFGADGGITINKLGQEATESAFSATMPARTNRMKATVTITGGRLVSSLTVEGL